MRPLTSDQAISSAIRISRVLGILGIIYVHAWTGRGGSELLALASTPQGIFRWGLIDLVGRSAVPLLSVISGWLVASSVQKRSYWGFVWDKAEVLIGPMLAWNLIAMTLVCTAAAQGWLQAPTATSVGWVINELFCLTAPNDVNVQISFLRDLFVCMLEAPLLVRLSERVVFGLIGLVAIWCVGGWNFFILLRPQILLFFLQGLMARRRDWAEPLGRLAWPLAAVLFCLASPLSIVQSVWGQAWADTHPVWSNALDVAQRLGAALFVWRLATALARRPVGLAISRLAPLAFLMFCAHLTMIWFAGPWLGRLTGPLGAPGYPLFLMVQPLLVLVATIALREALITLSPHLAAFLTGGQIEAAPASAFVKPDYVGEVRPATSHN